MKTRQSILGIILCSLLSLVGCQSSGIQSNESISSQSSEVIYLSTERTQVLHGLAVQFTDYLESEQIDSATEMLDTTMTTAMNGKMSETWQQLIAAGGAFVETGDYVGIFADGYDILEMTLVFENASVVERVVFDSEDQITGLFFRNGAVDSSASGNTGSADDSAQLPDGVVEENVTVMGEPDYLLAGKLTKPAEGSPRAAIVLVHGSGASDMDETIGANAPFRDLAYSLAEDGIAVLRYDKRTFTYGEQMVNDSDTITLEDEVITDAVAAVKTLKSQEGINSDRVFLAGHSMSGGLLSTINARGANCAGYIILAGSPRNIWELSADQNLALADEMAESKDSETEAEIRSFIEDETQKAKNLANLNSSETVFGTPVSYLLEFEQIDASKLHLADGLPVLILQGEKDRQVTLTDLAFWREQLSDHPRVTFITYPTLNHLFGEYEGETVPLSELVSVEYAQRTPVPAKASQDIVDWIEQNS